MRNISKFEKEKLLHLLECSEEELNNLTEKSNSLLEEKNSTYDVLLKILQQGFNIREAVLSAIILGQKLGYKKAKIEMEEEIKDQLYKAFKNSQ
ncbi:MAG: hypothetical protein CMD14_02540 [Flavobacteriales bacterium]|nr:hypothetical protein [Flavobacteriales bacterium]|tara:strand:+ start:1928 stop:2209 length:282 start_codon:yes stop_codon:yes gene_type:complete